MAAPRTDQLQMGTAAGRWVVTTSVLGSGMAFLDSTVVNVALPSIGEELQAQVAGLQWTITGYLLALSSLILVGGSLADRFGRRRVFQVGVGWFAVASMACGAAPNMELLVVARVVQGVGGALLTPASLALLEATFTKAHRPRAIGAWSALTGVAVAVGPLLGGLLVDAGSWRLVFWINPPIAAVVIWLAAGHVPESRDPDASGGVDVRGATLAAGGLSGVTFAAIRAGDHTWTDPWVVTTGIVGLVLLTAFVLVEKRAHDPMLPLPIFRSSQFTAANAVTVVVYAALGTLFVLLILQLQQTLGYSATEAGLATLPVTALMVTLSTPSGDLAQRIGPRLQMSVGPLLLAVGLVLLLRVEAGASYVSGVLPGVIVIGLGLATTVAPLTATAMAAVPRQHAGLASGVNNTVARTAQLLAVAVVPVVAGITGDVYRQPEQLSAGFHRAMLITAGLAALGGVLAWSTIRNPLAVDSRPAGSPAN